MPGHSGYPFPVASEPLAAILDRDGYSKRDYVSSSASQRSLDLAGRGPVSDGILATFGVVISVIQPIAIVDARTVPSDRRDSKRMVASFAAERDEVDPTRGANVGMCGNRAEL